MRKFLPFLAGALALSNVAFGQTDAEKARVANEERVAKEAYQLASKNKKKKTRVNLNENYIGWGLGYVKGISPASPLKSGVNFNFTSGFVVAKNRLLLEAQVNYDLMFSPNKNWYAVAYDMPVSSLDGFLFGNNVDATFGAYPILVNKRNLSVTAGPFVGVAMVDIMAPMDMSYNAPVYSTPLEFTYCYGLKAALFLGEHVTFNAQYTLTGVSTIETAYPAHIVSFNTLRMGVTFMRPSWW